MNLIIAISGKIGSGKDTLADMLQTLLINKGYKVQRDFFAEPLRRMVTDLTGHTDFSQEGKQKFLDKFGMTVGTILQKIGEGLRIEVGEDVWVNSFKSRYMTDTSKEVTTITLMTDIRYYNEIVCVKGYDGLTIRLNGDPAGVNAASTRSKIHRSEVELDMYKGFNYIYENTSGLDLLNSFAEKLVLSL